MYIGGMRRRLFSDSRKNEKSLEARAHGKFCLVIRVIPEINFD